MFKKNRFTFLLLVMCKITWATSQNVAFPHSSRALFSATGSSIGIFGGDVMLPVYGNKDGFAFGDFMGDYGTNETFLVSPGGGVRKVIGNQIIGGYFFGDYEKTSLDTHFWDLSPGVEWITTHWDAHLNGYFPTTKKQQFGSQDFLNNYGDSSRVYFETGTHNQYDEQVTPYAVIGDGADAELGYSFASKNNLRSRVYVGAYYYQPPDYDNVENITGATAGFEQAITKNVAIAIRNSYDQVSHYTVGVSLIVTFGGESNLFTNNVRDRLLDPVQRHVGILGTGAGTYDQQYLENNGTALEYDNVYFISPEGIGDGTYGNAASLTQSTLDSAYAEDGAGSRLYLEGGSNSIYYVNSETTDSSDSTGFQATAYPTSPKGLMVYPNQDFYGRSADYTTPASGSEQPQIEVDGVNNYNGFLIQGGGENTFSDLTITEYSSSRDDYPTSGIIATNNTEEDRTLNIINTHIIGMDAYGVYAENNNTGAFTINAINSQFNDNGVIDRNFDGTGNSVAGIYAENNNTGIFIINAEHSQFNGNGVMNGSKDGIGGIVAGIDAENNNTGVFMINAKNSQFNENGVINGNHAGTGTVAGINAENTTSGTFNMKVINSQFNGNGVITGNHSGMEMATGLMASNNGAGEFNITAKNSQFNDNGMMNGDHSGMGVAAGMSVINNGSGTFILNTSGSEFDNNGDIEVDDSGMGLATGIYMMNASDGTIIIS